MTPVGRAFNLHCTTEKIDVIVVDVNLNHIDRGISNLSAYTNAIFLFISDLFLLKLTFFLNRYLVIIHTNTSRFNIDQCYKFHDSKDFIFLNQVSYAHPRQHLFDEKFRNNYYNYQYWKQLCFLIYWWEWIHFSLVE